MADELEVEEQDTSELVVEFEVANAAFEEVAADKEAFAYVVGAEVGQDEAELGGKDKAESETEEGIDHAQVCNSSDHVAAQQVAAVVVVELAPDSGMVEQQEPEYVVVETVLVPEIVVAVEAEIGVVPVAGAGVEAGPGAVIETDVGVDHRPAGTVEPQTVDRGSNVDSAVDMDLVQGIAGSIVDIVAADTIALPLAAQQLGFGKLSWVADLKPAQA